MSKYNKSVLKDTCAVGFTATVHLLADLVPRTTMFVLPSTNILCSLQCRDRSYGAHDMSG